MIIAVIFLELVHEWKSFRFWQWIRIEAEVVHPSVWLLGHSVKLERAKELCLTPGKNQRHFHLSVLLLQSISSPFKASFKHSLACFLFFIVIYRGQKRIIMMDLGKGLSFWKPFQLCYVSSTFSADVKNISFVMWMEPFHFRRNEFTPVSCFNRRIYHIRGSNYCNNLVFQGISIEISFSAVYPLPKLNFWRNRQDWIVSSLFLFTPTLIRFGVFYECNSSEFCLTIKIIE